MKTYLLFLTESSLALALLYAVYWFGLRRETFFRVNRYFLSGALITSVIMALFPVHYISNAEPVAFNLSSLAAISSSGTSSVSPEKPDLFFRCLTWIYFTGAGLLFFRLVIQTVYLARIVFRSSPVRYKNIYVVENRKYQIPFSFLNLVFYNPDLHGRKELEEIIVHEKVHIQERHWIDLMIVELLSVVFWFNPFVWLYERSIKQNHEYLADAGVLAQGHPVGRYQALLINQLVGSQVVVLANHLNFSLNATRFKMMTKKETPKIRVMRMAWALPVAALLLWAFAEPSYQENLSGTSSLNQEKVINANPAEQIKISGTVVTSEGKPLQGASVILGGTNTGTVSGADGSFKLSIPVNPAVHLVISFVGYETRVIKIGSPENGKSYKVEMKEAVVEIGKPTGSAIAPPPPPPPPPLVGDKKTEQGVEVIAKPGEGEITPPPPAPTTGSGRVNDNSPVEEIFVVVEEMPQFPGGEKALQQYITEMKQKIAQAEGVQGKASIRFKVNKDGNVTDVTVTRQDNEAAGKAASHIVQNMPQWKPGTQRGKAVAVWYALPVEF